MPGPHRNDFTFWTWSASSRHSFSVGRLAVIATISLLAMGCGASVLHEHRTDPRGALEAEDRDLTPEAARVLVALDARLTVWQRPDGTRVHVRHCRKAPSGCSARLLAFAKMITDAAERHDLDPLLLAAVAMRESGFNPGAVGRAGEAGILQLHPSSVGRQARFVQDPDYREDCVEHAGACQEPVIELGAAHLAEAIERCGGVEAGLGKYNTGRCAGRRIYAERILRERERLRAYVRESERSK
jgi:hypothetical protein